MAHTGTVHKYSKKLVAFEHSSAPSPGSNDAPNTLLWIGGLGDGLLTVAYPATIASTLPSNWVIAEVILRSSYNGWATGRLSRDAREIGECVDYFRNLRPGKKVVLMGHSTGCQDIMEYLVGPDAKNQPPIDGAILQGGVSDRQAWEDMLENDEQRKEFKEIVDKAKEMIDDGDEKGILPVKGNLVAEGLGAPITAYRTYSLLSKGGDDDYFSTDLSDEHFHLTFGKIPQTTPLCFLLGNEDPYVPAKINKSELLQRWTKIVREGGGVVDDTNGGVVEGAHHNLNGDPDEVVQDLVKRVVGFVEGVEKNNHVVSQSTAMMSSMDVDHLCPKVPSQPQHAFAVQEETLSPLLDADIPKKKRTHRGVRGSRKVKEEAKRANMRKDKVQPETSIAATTDAEEQVLGIGDGEWEVVVRPGKGVS